MLSRLHFNPVLEININSCSKCMFIQLCYKSDTLRSNTHKDSEFQLLITVFYIR